jgi:hypothetical protein
MEGFYTMTAQPQVQRAIPTLLRRVLIVDALYEATLGLICLAGAAPIGSYMGLDSVWLVILGIAALAAAALLAAVTAAQRWTRGRIMLVIALNILGAMLLALLAVANVVPLTGGGKVVTLITAADFGILGALEYYALRRAR